MLKENVQELFEKASVAFSGAESSTKLYDFKVEFLGKSGKFTGLMKQLGGLSKEERPLFGKIINEKKNVLEGIYQAKEKELKSKEIGKKLENEFLDLSLPGPKKDLGSTHPLSKTIHEIVDILSRIGYSVRTGPLIEKDEYNFEALNIPKNHPARDMQDTFYVDDDTVLRTHTSPIQIRTMLSETPPLRILAPGSVFRCDSDATHSPNFYQIEGLAIDKEISMAHLKGTITFFVKEFFDSSVETRFRPSFFPFTEPSAEVDCSCPMCKGEGCRVCSNTGWIEIGGCGLVNPKVLDFVKYDNKQWQGFAFGFGIERMAMIKYGIGDIRLFNENNTQFLRQF